MDGLNELCFTGGPGGLSKSVLLWCQDIMCIKIFHDMGMNYKVHYSSNLHATETDVNDTGLYYFDSKIYRLTMVRR